MYSYIGLCIDNILYVNRGNCLSWMGVVQCLYIETNDVRTFEQVDMIERPL